MNGFVYCWTDKKENMLYVGSHKGKTNDGYICSSKLMLQEYKNRPNDFSRQIVAEGEYIDMRKLEEKILQTLNAAKDKQFYNMHNGSGNFYLKKHTEETKQKFKGKKKSPEHCKALSESKKGKKWKFKYNRRSYVGENNPNFNKKPSKKIIQKMKIAQQKYVYIVDGNKYHNMNDIAKKYNVTVSCVFGRLKSNSKKWFNWFYEHKPKTEIKIIKRPDLALRNKERKKTNGQK